MTVALVAVLVLAIALNSFLAFKGRSPRTAPTGTSAEGVPAPVAGSDGARPIGPAVAIPPQLYEPHLGRPRKPVMVVTSTPGRRARPSPAGPRLTAP